MKIVLKALAACVILQIWVIPSVNFTPSQLTNNGEEFLGFPGGQGPAILYRLATWESYKTLAEVRREIITNIEIRETIKLQIVSNQSKADPVPYAIGGGVIAIAFFILGVLVAK